MSTPRQFVGRIESVWRYPVKSMRGEDLARAFVGFAGVYGDRLYAFRSSAAAAGFPYLTAREQQQMLQCRVRFRHPERAIAPPNLAAAEAMGPGVTPLYGDAADMIVDVITPGGELFAVDDPRVIDRLREGQRDGLRLSLIRSDRALTDCRPISIISRQTARQLSDEVGIALDPRRFRANIYVDLETAPGFGENDWVGRRLRIGDKVEVAVLERDHRCKMITLDPETGEANPDIMRCVAQQHEGMAGVYAAVLVEGTIRPGDRIALVD